MYTCRCRALTSSGTPVYFTAAELPVCVNTEQFTLANCPSSPLLRLSTITRVLDDSDLGEGDTILVNGTCMRLYYAGGFFLSDIVGRMQEIPEDLTYKLLSIGDSSGAKLRFKYKDYVFPIQSFLGRIGNKGVLAAYPEYIDPKLLQISTGVTYQRQRLFFGDQLEEGEVVMRHGSVGVQIGDDFFAIRKGKIVGGEENGSNSKCPG